MQILQIISIVLVAIGMALSLAHALELPGKLRLSRDAYLAVQTIYYPGFTIGGLVGEPGAIAATIILLALTTYGTAAFWADPCGSHLLADYAWPVLGADALGEQVLAQGPGPRQVRRHVLRHRAQERGRSKP